LVFTGSGLDLAATFLTAAVRAEAAFAATRLLAGLLFGAGFAGFFAVFVATCLWSLIPLYIKGRESTSIFEAFALVI
jgi:hypothetical protein